MRGSRRGGKWMAEQITRADDDDGGGEEYFHVGRIGGVAMILYRHAEATEKRQGWQRLNAKAGSCADGDGGEGEENFHVGTKSL